MLVGSDVTGEGDHVNSSSDVDAVVVGVAAGTDLVGCQGTVMCPSMVAGHATATPVWLVELGVDAGICMFL